MCEDGSCDLDHDHDHDPEDDDDIYIDETVGYVDALAEFVENMEGFQFDD